MIDSTNPFKTKEFTERYKSFRSNQEFIKFCEKRKFTQDFIKLTGVSYFSKDLIVSNFSQQTQIELGLKAGDKFPYFSHLVFPTFNLAGVFSGFIGRVTFKDSQPKYQLPQHILFAKETYLHGFYRYADTADEYVFVTENMVEWGRILQCGFPCVGLNGAFKSKFKLSILANRFKHIILVTDNDKAGQELKSFSEEYLKELGVSVQSVSHRYKGLDEFFCAEGLDNTTQLLKKYVSRFD